MSKTEAVTTKQHVRASFRDAIFTSLNIGMVESYVGAFMLALGINEVVSGLGTIIPQFIGVIFQLFSIRSFFTKYSLKRRLLIFLSFQILSMIPLILAGVFKINSAVLIIGIMGIYWASLLSLNPPWNRLMGHTVPKKFRLKFFSIRSQFAQFSVFMGLIISGLLLYWAKDHGKEMPVYVGIISFGVILKCLSWFEIKSSHNDYALATGTEERLPLRVFLKRLRQTDQGKLITFLFFFYVSVYFAAPYFTPYMFKELKWNYFQFMSITSVAYFGRVIMLKILQKWAKSRHVDRILLFSTIGISSAPILWAFLKDSGLIFAVELISGCAWAGFELSTILLYYQKIDDRERTSVITYIALLNTTGMLFGSMLGALFMKLVPAGWDQYFALFVVASFLRLGLVMFAPQINFKGQIPKFISSRRVLNVIMPMGLLGQPVVKKVKKEEEEKK